MKLKNYLLLLFLGMFTTLSASVKMDSKTTITFLKQNYNKALILQAIDQVLEYDRLGISIIPREGEMDYGSYAQRAEAMVMSHPNIVDIAFSKVTSKNDSDVVIDHIANWCDVFTTLSQLSRLDINIPLQQVLFETSSGKVVVDSFLVGEEQNWKNLTSTQIGMLPYVATNTLYKLSESDRLQFYKDFHTKVFEINLNQED